MTVVQVPLAERPYPVTVGAEGWAAFAAQLRSAVRGEFALLVTDDRVAPHWLVPVRDALAAAGWRLETRVLPAGEATKSLAAAATLYDALVEAQADRHAAVVSVGGGVISDLAGFVAATYARGIAFAPVPTTLLAMVDAAVGGKVAVDHPRAKNIIGCFHQPALVWCHLQTLATLPEAVFRAGLAETVKHGFILDPEYLAFQEREAAALLRREPAACERLVAESCRIKAGVVAADERETLGLRSALNFGHTFGHAFETMANYELPHGDAVALGMMCAARLSVALGRVGPDYLMRLQALLDRFGLPTTLPKQYADAAAVELMRGDKKAAGREIRVVLPTRVGHVELVGGVPDAAILAALRAAC